MSHILQPIDQATGFFRFFSRPFPYSHPRNTSRMTMNLIARNREPFSSKRDTTLAGGGNWSIGLRMMGAKNGIPKESIWY